MSEKKPNKDLLSIGHVDDQENYEEFSDFLDSHTARQKHHIASEIEEIGEDCLKEIDHKKTVKEISQKKLIKYILKKSNKYSEEYLLDLDFNDVNDIHKELKYENRSFFRKLWEFFFPPKNMVGPLDY